MAVRTKTTLGTGEPVDTAAKIQQLAAKANATFGQNGRVLVCLGNQLPEMSYVRTGNDLIDAIILGGRGLPQGTIAQLIGWEGSGKSRFLKSWIRAVQLAYPTKYVAVLPTERADYTPDTLLESGIDPNRLIVIGGTCAEDMFDMLKSFMVDDDGNCLNLLSMWAVDSVPGLRPKATVKKSFSDSERMAATAALLHEVLRDLSYAQGDGIGVIVNQLRDTISRNGMPSPPHPYGGKAVLFWPKLTLRLQRFEPEKSAGKWYEQQLESFQITAVAEKNNTSIGVPGAQVYYKVHTVTTDDCPRGVSEMESLIRAGVMLGIVKKSGGWFQWGPLGEKKFNGEANFSLALQQAGLLDSLRETVMDKAWEKASAGRIVVNKFVIDQETGELLSEAEAEGVAVQDAGKLHAPIDLSDDGPATDETATDTQVRETEASDETSAPEYDDAEPVEVF